MKFLLKSFALALALGATSSAFANSNPVSSTLESLSGFAVISPAPQSFFGGRDICRYLPFLYICKAKKDDPKDDPDPVAVPELNAAAAPISAAIVLSALALGAERRRRKIQVQRTA